MMCRKIFLSDLILYLIFYVSIIIDSINGVLQEYLNLSIPIGILFRGILCLLMVKFIIFKPPLSNYKIFIGCVFILYLILILYWDSSDISQNLIFALKYFYYFVVICFFLRVYHKNNLEKIVKLVVNSATIIGLLNILCLLAGIGLRSYDTAQFGYKAFYIDGNGLGVSLIISLSVAIWYAFVKHSVRLWLKVVLISLGTMIIGSRTAIAGTLIIFLFLFLYVAVKKDKLISISFFKRFAIIIIICIIVGGALSGLIYVLSNADSFIVERFTFDSASSPREKLLSSWDDVMRNYNLFDRIVGKGVVGARESIGHVLGTQSRSIEADFHEIILSFGWLFGGLMICSFIYPLFISIFWRKKNKSFLNFTIILSLSIWVGHAFLAGHCFTNVMHAPLIASLLAIGYNSKSNGCFSYIKHVSRPE